MPRPVAPSQRLHSRRPSGSTDGDRSWLWLNEIWLDVGAVGLHHVQHEGALAAVVGLRLVAGLAFVAQDGLRLALARRGEDDAAVGQVVRRDVMAFRGDRVRGDHATQRVGRDVVFPDRPGRRIFLVLVHRQRSAHREDELPAVDRDVHVLDVVTVGRAGDAFGDVALRRRRRGAVAHPQIRIRRGVAQGAHVVLVRRDRAFHVGDREIDRARVGGLAAAEIDAAAATAGGEQRPAPSAASSIDCSGVRSGSRSAVPQSRRAGRIA